MKPRRRQRYHHPAAHPHDANRASRGDLAQSKRQVAAALVEDNLTLMKEALARGEMLKVSSFGAFDVMDKSPRIGRIPQTGAAIMIMGR